MLDWPVTYPVNPEAPTTMMSKLRLAIAPSFSLCVMWVDASPYVYGLWGGGKMTTRSPKQMPTAAEDALRGNRAGESERRGRALPTSRRETEGETWCLVHVRLTPLGFGLCPPDFVFHD